MKPTKLIGIGCLALLALLVAGGRAPVWAGATAPPPPDDFRAEGIDGGAVLRWTAYGNTADSFNIYWTTDCSSQASPKYITGSSKITVPRSEPTLYVLTGLTNGQSYCFGITGVNVVGESTPAPLIPTATPNTNPRSAPTAFIGTTGDKTVTLSWIGIPGASGYRIYWSNTPGVTPGNGTAIDVAAQSTAGQSFTMSGLTNFRHYYFIVAALNGATLGNPTGQICATPSSSSAIAPPPGAPVIHFTASPASIPSGQSSALSWTITNATSAGIDQGIGVINASAGSSSVSPNTTTTYTLTATGPGGTTTAQVTVTVTTVPPQIVLNKSSSPTSVASGGTVTFTIQYQNAGAGNATNVVITDVIPAGSTLVASSISTGGTVSGNTITWPVGNVAAGATGTVSFQVTAN